jgi:2,3-dihydroxyphenylpropionate 1,2-dioxygenase
MTFAVAGLSHAPVFGRVDPGGSIYEEILEAIERTKKFVADFDPEVVVSFGPDHFNGVLYEMMPPFCIGAQAFGVGDWGTYEGALPVDSELARRLHYDVLDQGTVDVARSERLYADHGMMQSLEFIFGARFSREFIPVFVNCVGKPLTTMQRIRLLGEAIGKAALKLDKRVLFTASGGLSHDPPIADFDSAPAELRERLTHATITPEMRAERESMILAAATEKAAGSDKYKDVNSAWDRQILGVLASNDLSQADRWRNDWMVAEGGSGAQEMRTWLAAWSALSAAGRYETVEENYWASKPWGCGFGIVTARTAQ